MPKRYCCKRWSHTVYNAVHAGLVVIYIYILTFGSCACGVTLLSTGANIPLAQVVVYIYGWSVILYILSDMCNMYSLLYAYEYRMICTYSYFISLHMNFILICKKKCMHNANIQLIRTQQGNINNKGKASNESNKCNVMFTNHCY